MKKLLVGIIAAFMMAASLVAATGTSASAKNCGYGGCLPTDTQVKIKNKRGCKIQVKAGVSAGNVVVNRGRIKIQVKGNGVYRQKIRNAPNVTVNFKLRPGTYLVQAKYIPDGSRFNRSAESTIVTVNCRRR